MKYRACKHASFFVVNRVNLFTSRSAPAPLPRCTRAVRRGLRGGGMRRLYALLPCTEGMAPDTSESPSPSPRALQLILPSRTSDGQPRSADFR
jgi:hypothetical protein